MLDGTALRASSWLWVLRLVQVIFGFIALGIVGSNGADFKAMGCNLPANINIGIAVVSYYSQGIRLHTPFLTVSIGSDQPPVLTLPRLGNRRQTSIIEDVTMEYLVSARC